MIFNVVDVNEKVFNMFGCKKERRLSLKIHL